MRRSNLPRTSDPTASCHHKRPWPMTRFLPTPDSPQPRTAKRATASLGLREPSVSVHKKVRFIAGALARRPPRSRLKSLTHFSDAAYFWRKTNPATRLRCQIGGGGMGRARRTDVEPRAYRFVWPYRARGGGAHAHEPQCRAKYDTSRGRHALAARRQIGQFSE